MMHKQVFVVYVCPTDGCNGYYGSSSMPPLESEEVIAPPEAKDGGQVRHMRSRCPICGADRKRRLARLIPESEVAEARQKIQSKGDIS